MTYLTYFLVFLAATFLIYYFETVIGARALRKIGLSESLYMQFKNYFTGFYKGIVFTALLFGATLVFNNFPESLDLIILGMFIILLCSIPGSYDSYGQLTIKLSSFTVIMLFMIFFSVALKTSFSFRATHNPFALLSFLSAVVASSIFCASTRSVSMVSNARMLAVNFIIAQIFLAAGSYYLQLFEAFAISFVQIVIGMIFPKFNINLSFKFTLNILVSFSIFVIICDIIWFILFDNKSLFYFIQAGG